MSRSERRYRPSPAMLEALELLASHGQAVSSTATQVSDGDLFLNGPTAFALLRRGYVIRDGFIDDAPLYRITDAGEELLAERGTNAP